MSWNIAKIEPKGEIIVRIDPNDTKNKICARYGVALSDLEYNEWRTGAYLCIKKSFRHIHIVKPLETLQTIAQKYDIAIEDLVAKNGLKNNCVFIGQQLILD